MDPFPSERRARWKLRMKGNFEVITLEYDSILRKRALRKFALQNYRLVRIECRIIVIRIREKCASEFFINWNNFPERTRDIYCIEKLSRDPCNVPKYVSIITGEQLQLINPRINRFVIHLWDECFCSKRYYCSHATCLRNPQSDLRIHPTLPFDNIDPSKPSRDET